MANCLPLGDLTSSEMIYTVDVTGRKVSDGVFALERRTLWIRD